MVFHWFGKVENAAEETLRSSSALEDLCEHLENLENLCCHQKFFIFGCFCRVELPRSLRLNLSCT